MRVLAVLWTVCLVRFCSASWFSGKSKTDDKDAEIIAVEQPLKFHPPSDPKTVDLASLTDPRYKTVDVDIVGVPARVYMINQKEDIKKVKYNGKDVWKASRVVADEKGYNTTPEEICTYCITFIKGTGTAMILVEIHDLSIYREIFRYKQKTGSNGNESGWERSPTGYGKEIATLRINTDPPTKFTLDISSLEEDDERFKLVREEKNATTLYYSSQPGNLIEKIVDGGRNIFTVPDNHICYLCELHSKGESKLLRIHAEHSYKISLFYYENTGSGWKIIHKDDFLKKLDEMNKSGKNLSDASKQVVAPKPAPTPVHDLKSKVDSTLFDVEEGQENGFKVLKLKAKEGTSTNKLLFDGKPVWQSQNVDDSCSMAIFYLGKEGLVGASYRFKRENDGKTVEGYRQFSNGNWLQVRGDAFKKLIGKDDHVAKRGESSTKSAEHGATLDISSPDETKVDLKKGDESGLDYNIYSPKDGSKITSVVENGALVWTASGAGQKCLFVELHGKEELILAYSKVESDSGLDLKYFKKVGGTWNEIDKNTFNEVKTMDSKQGPPKSHSGATDEVHEETVETPTQKEKNSEKSVVPPGESSLKYPHLEENERKQPPLTPLPGGLHTNRPSLNVQRIPPRPGGLRETATRDTLPGVKPTGTQTAVGKSTNTTAVNSKPSTRPVIEDIGEDLEEDLKHVKAYHENMQETTKTAPEVTSTTVPTEKPLEYKMDMALVTVGKSTEGTLSVVTYTAKQDAHVPLLLHDNKLVWRGIDSMSNKDTLVKATVYLGSGGPLAANLTYKRVTESTTKEYCKLVRDRWTFVDKSTLERTFDEVEIPGNANASAYRTKVDSTLFDVEVGKHNGIPVLNCTAKKGVKVPKLVYDSNVVWQADGNQSCSSATFYFGKSGIIGISFTYGSIEETLHDCFRVFSNDEWEGVNGDYYERVLYEAKNPETSVATASENTKAKSFIDTAKFTVVSDMDDTVPILRCTAGNGASKLTYGSDTIWPGKKDVTCLSAVLYLDGDKPTLAVLVTRDNNNKQNKVYKYHDGKKWKNYKEKDHQSKFEELKKVIENRIRQHKILIASRTVDIAKFDANKGQSFDYTVDNVPVKMFIPKDNVTINRLVNGGTYLWSTENGKCTIIMLYLNKDNKPELVYIVRFIQGDSYSGFYKKDEDSKWTETEDFDYEFKKLRTAPTSSSQFTLDLSAHQDTTECRIFQAPLYGTNTRFYAPKSGHHASYIAHNGVSIWTAEEGERCTFVTSYLKDGQEHLFRMTTKNTNDKSSMKYFEKAGRGWKSVTKEDFDVKYDNLKSNAYKPSSIKDENTHKGHTQPSKRTPVKETLLDIGKPDLQSYKSFDYALDDVPTRLIVAVKEQPNRIVFGQETVWSYDTGRCNYCTVHMKDNRPVLVYISGRSFSLSLLRTDGGWKSIDNYSEEFAKLRLAVPSPSSFSLDISTNQDSPNCRIFDTPFNKVNTRFYVPKAGRYVTSVSHGQAVLWKGDNEKAILVRLYPSDNPTLLHMLSKDTNGAFKHSYLVKSGSNWESINKDVHDRLLSEIKATAPGKHTDVGKLRQELMESQASLDKLVESKKFTDCDGPEDPSTLDIVHYEESNAYIVTNCTLDGYPTTVFIPDKGSIKKVVYGSLTIWEGSEKEECKYLMAHYVYSIPAFAYLIKGSDKDVDLYFANKGDNWEEIRVEYVRKLNELRRDRPASGDHVIDIKDTTSNEKCKVYSYTIDGVLTYSYYPHPEVTVKNVMEGGINVWNEGAGGKCLYITVTRVDKDGFMYFVTSSGYNIKYHVYHMGSNGNWTISYSNNYGSKWNELINKKDTLAGDKEISNMRQERLHKVAQVKTLSRDCMIDVRDISVHEKHKIIKTFINNIPALVYIPGPTFNFSKIILDNIEFSHYSAEDEFKGLSSLLKDNELSIMHLSEVYKGESSDNYYDFADTNGKCSSADVETLKSHQHSRFIFSLDISRRGTDGCKFVSFHNDGVLTHTHVVNAGYTANMVTDGALVLWKSKADEKCLYALTSFLDGIPVLLNIFVRLPDGKLEHYYFYNHGEWTVINTLDYKGILEDLSDTIKSRLSESIDRDNREVLSLDVAKVDTNKYTMETTKLRVLTSIKYSPPENSRVTKVVFGNDSLWQTLKASVQCNFAVITYRGISIELAQLCIVDGCEKCMHFEMEDGRLSSITAEEYNDALSRLDSGDGASDEDFEFIISTIDTLDLMTPAEVDFEIDRFQLDSLSSAVYLPLPKHTIGRVVLGKVLWTSDESKCLYVSTFSTEESIQLVQIVTENETLHFARLDKELAKVPQKKYNELFEKLGYRQVDQTPFYVPLEVPDAPNTISLDVSKALDSRVKAENGTFKGVSYTTFYTSEEGVIDKISSGKLTVWEPEENEVCVYGRLYLDNGPKLLKIRTVGEDGSNIVHLALDTDKWICLSQDVFNDRLNLMVLRLTEPLKFALTTTTDGYYEYTFDLSRYHLDSRFNSGFITYGGHKYAVCTPKNGVIKKVVQGNITIWTPSSDDYYANMILLSRDTHLYILVQSSFNIPAVLSYHLKNNVWNMVNHEAISTDITKTLPIPSFRLTLDLTGKHDPEKYRVFKMDINGVTTTVFITIYGYYFDKVVSGKDLIWQSSENEECRYLMVLDKSGKNSFITLFVDYMDGSKFMVYEMKDKWTFSHQLLGPKNDHKTTVSTVFNLSDKTHQNVYFCDNVFNGIKHRAYSPSPGYHVQEVKDTDTTIWQAEDKEQCIFILSVPGTDKSTTSLLSLFVRNEDYCGFKHFEKTDKWRHIDERGYDRRLIEKKQANNVTTAVAISNIPQYKNAVTLDTANVDHDRIDVHEDSLNGVRHLYSAKTNDYFNGLLDNSKSIWKSDKDKCLTVAMYGKDELHCRLDVLSSDVITPMYFCRKAGNWSSTNYNTFHEWLRNYVKTPRIKLDLDNLDTNFFESFRYTQNGYEILYGRPLPGYALTTVVDGSTEVWEAGHNQYATEFQMSIIGDYTLLSIINHSYQVENLCFLKSSNSWSPIDEDVYDQYLVPVNDSERVQDTQLDLSKPDFSIVVGHKDVMGDVTILGYTPHLGRHVTAVAFGEYTIWYRKYHDEYCISAEHITKGGAIFIRLLLKMGSSFEHRYFTKVNNKWVTLKEEEFKNKLGIQDIDVNAKSILEDNESDPNVYTLDISGAVDRDKIIATETIYEEVKSVTYSPKFIAGIGKVVDSDGTVWMGASDQKCVTVVISSKDGYDPLVSLSINSDIVVQYKYLVKKDREWYLIRKTKYDELLTTMYRHSLVTHADTTFDNPITLDISTEPTEGVTLHEYTYNEVTYKTFKPKDDRSILEVVDSKSMLWKSSSGKFIDAWTYSTPLSSLCRLDILSSGIITPHCFEKKGSVWISLGLKLYTEKLQKLLSYKSINVMIEASGVSRDIGTVVKYFDKHAISTTIVPKFNIAKINYNKDMWESHGKQCINAHFITSPGGDLAYINAKSSNGDISPSSFYYSSGKWHEGNHYNFTNDHSKLPPLPKDVFNGKLIDTTLDIRNVDNTFRVYNYSNSVVTHFEYQTPMNANVKRIVDGAQIIVWQGGENDRCLACEVYSREGYDPVLGFMIKNKYNVSISFFEKGGNEWNEINEETFNLRLASFSNNSRLQLLKDRLVDTFENADIFDRKTSCTSEDMNILYLNQWLLSHVPHWMMNHFKTLHQKKKSLWSRLR